MIPEIECKKCHLRWVPRAFPRPKKCPRCHTPYKGPIVVSALLPFEVDDFLAKIGFNDYDKMIKEMIACQLEGWQLSEVDKGEGLDETLFRESCEVLKMLGCPERIIRDSTILPLPPKAMRILER